MRIDMSKIISDRPVAVHFNSEEDAALFLEEMRERYPRHVRGWTRVIYPVGYLKYGGVCYCPYLNYAAGSMTHSSKRHFEEDCGYEVVEFEDLLCNDTDIVEAELPITFLFS